MAIINNISLSAILFLGALLVFACNAEATEQQQPNVTNKATNTNANANVNPFCHTASIKALCTKMVSGAKTWEEATRNAIKATSNQLSRNKGLVEGIQSLLNSLPIDHETKSSVLETCQENYQTNFDLLNQSLELLEGGNKEDLLSYLAGVRFSDCVEALQEFEIDSPAANQYNDKVRKRVENLLAVASQETV